MPGSDIASDHTGFLGTNSAFATTPVALANIENGAWHPVVVTWNAATQTLSYTFDGQPMGTPLTSNIATQFLGGSNFAYFGFGAGTGGLSNTQSVRNISVTATFEGQAPGNSPPIAVADTATTTAGTPVVIAVLANDSDPDNNPLTIAAVSNFVNGTAAINPDKTITYTPTPGFTGSGGFTYTISDGTSQRSAPVSVTVTPPTGNSPPIAVADAATTAAGTPVVIAVLANDSDPDNNPLTIAAVSNFVNGTAAINRQQDDHLYPHPGLHRFWRLYLYDLRRNNAEIRASQRDGHVAAARRRDADAARERERREQRLHSDVGRRLPGRHGDVDGAHRCEAELHRRLRCQSRHQRRRRRRGGHRVP